MKLAQTILENERNNAPDKNLQLVRVRLKEMVYAYPDEVKTVLHKTGVPVSTVLPPSVLHAIVVKNLATNAELRETIGKMLLELDSYASADGAGWQLIGGSLAAIGSVLTGIGRSQGVQAEADANLEAEAYKKQLEMEQAKRRRMLWLTIGISAVVIIGIIIAFKTLGKKAAVPSTSNFAMP